MYIIFYTASNSTYGHIELARFVKNVEWGGAE